MRIGPKSSRNGSRRVFCARVGDPVFGRLLVLEILVMPSEAKLYLAKTNVTSARENLSNDSSVLLALMPTNVDSLSCNASRQPFRRLGAKRLTALRSIDTGKANPNS